MNTMQSQCEPNMTLSLCEVVGGARQQLHEMTGLQPCSTVEVTQTDDGWRVIVELLERKSVPDTMDLLAAYEAELDAAGKMRSFTRIRLRRRCDVAERAV